MATRGLIIIKEKNRAIAVYNKYDSYPEGLGADLCQIISDTFENVKNKKRAIKSLKRTILGWDSLRWDIDIESLENNPFIDYLLHEWIYVLDLERERLVCYKSVWLEDSSKPIEYWNKHRGTVITAFEIEFKDTATFEDFEGATKRALEECERIEEEQINLPDGWSLFDERAKEWSDGTSPKRKYFFRRFVNHLTNSGIIFFSYCSLEDAEYRFGDIKTQIKRGDIVYVIEGYGKGTIDPIKFTEITTLAPIQHFRFTDIGLAKRTLLQLMAENGC